MTLSLDELEKKLAEATSGHYELDRLIEVASGRAKGLSGTHGVIGAGGGYYSPRSYTSSLDAAVALCREVLPTWHWAIDSGSSWPRCHAEVILPTGRFLMEGDIERHAIGPTPALALCTAIVRALKAEREKK